MLSKFKKSNKKKTATRARFDHNVNDYGKEPLFVKKAEESKMVIEKYGLPKELLTSKKGL